MEKLKVKIEESVDGVSRLENLAYIILLATAFFLPVFFIPSASFPFQFSKVVFLSLAVLVTFALWLIARLKDGRYLLPNNIVFFASALVLLSVLVSSLASDAVLVSLIGQGYEIGSWANFVVLFLVMFLFSALFRPKERVFYLYLALFTSSFLIVLFHALRFVFGADFLSFGIFTEITSNLIGKWNDLGILFGLVAMLSFITLELMSFSRVFKVLLWIIFALSLISLIIVNFTTLWYAIGAFSLLYFVFSYSSKSQDVSESQEVDQEFASRRFVNRSSITAIILLVISIVMLIDNYTTERRVGNWISNQFNISQLEVRPNWSSTMQVAVSTLKQDPVLGAGPNRFVNQWLTNKPNGINEGVFWNTDFSFGIGLLPSQIVTTGLLGLISWLIFIVSIIYLGIKNLLTPETDRLHRYLSVSSFFGSVFLWTFFIFYVPSAVILTLTFLFTGVFIASLYNERFLKPKTVSFIEEPKVSFASVLVLTALLVGVVSLSYIFSQKFMASAYYQKAGIAFNAGDINGAEKYSLKALSLSKSDLYNRFLTALTLNKINILLTSSPSNSDVEKVRMQFQDLMGQAVGYARAATEIDQTNYQNWINLGRVYEAVVPLKIEGAYESAKAAYDKSALLNPKSPEINLIMARLELAKEARKEAKAQINLALAQKSNYTEAIFMMSQILAAEGKLKDAIASVESAAVLAPNDPTVFFQLGLFKYNNREYSGAIEALQRAVVLAPTYSNAKYFLGLSYFKVRKISDALTQFNDLKVLNPENAEIPTIISNIREGRDPFASISENNPENRETLPIEEEKVEEE